MTDTKVKKEEKIRLLQYAKEQYRKAKNLTTFLLETLKENKRSFLFSIGCTGTAGWLGAKIPLLGEQAVNMLGSNVGTATLGH